jgi:hypothetical protein
MPDILSQGSDREHGPRRRSLVIIAAVAVAAAVVIALRIPHHARPHHSASRAASAPAAGFSSAPVAGLPVGPDGITGPTLPWQRGLRLPIGGPRPAWYWPATGRTQPIGGLPGNSSGYQFTRAVGGWAVQRGAQPAAPTEPGSVGPPAPVYYLADRARSVTDVGAANLVVPAATGKSLWLTSYPADANPGSSAAAAQQVSVTGTRIGHSVRLPVGYVIDQATVRGLLLTPAIRGSGRSATRLWNPVTGRQAAVFRGVIAASPAKVAWVTRCAPRCRVRVLDLASGRRATVALPVGSSPASGAFSPDGSLLALQVSTGAGGDGGELAMQLDVASATTGRLTKVPGTWASSDALVGFGWPATGNSLVAELSFPSKVQLASWHPGAQRLAVAAIKPGPAAPAALVLG